MKKIPILVIILFLSFYSCKKEATIEGLWIVTSVVAGEEEMTPNARWARFNSDLTQESGNGRFQHSYGTWKLNSESNELTIQNANGLDDLNEPFIVTIDKNEMIWERTEEGQNIKVNLVRSSQLPETYGDRILGLWSLEEVVGDGSYFEESDKNKSSEYIFFKWDKRFVIASENGRIN